MRKGTDEPWAAGGNLGNIRKHTRRHCYIELLFLDENPMRHWIHTPIRYRLSYVCINLCNNIPANLRISPCISWVHGAGGNHQGGCWTSRETSTLRVGGMRADAKGGQLAQPCKHWEARKTCPCSKHRQHISSSDSHSASINSPPMRQSENHK